MMVAFQQGLGDFAFAEPRGGGQSPADGHALGSGDQVEAEPPEEP
jgi:hypothetical protein